MLTLKIRATVLNACDTLSANDPFRRRHCRGCLAFQNYKNKNSYFSQSINGLFITRTAKFSITNQIYLVLLIKKKPLPLKVGHHLKAHMHQCHIYIYICISSGGKTTDSSDTEEETGSILS